MSLHDLIHSQNMIGLSPMDGYTNEAFRLLATKIAKPDVIYTEFVSAEGLTRGGVKLYDTLLFSSSERPIIGQLFGKDPESFYKAAVVLCHLGFDGIDINMGCPAKTVTQHGSGAALIAQPPLATDLIKSVQSGVDDWFGHKVTVGDLGLNKKTLDIIKRNLKYSGQVEFYRPTISVKTRIGIDKPITQDWISHLLQHNLDFITVHGRTLKQGYSGVANWQEIAKAVSVAKDSPTKIWGNGDVNSHQQGIENCLKYGVTGVLIGRSALGNPWVFVDKLPDLTQKYQTMLLHANLFQQVFPNRLFDHLRKNFLLYTSGHPRAKQLRAKLVRLSSLEQLYALEDDFLSC